jgi:hypothetical protein
LETHHDERPSGVPAVTLRSGFPDSTISALRELFLRMVRTETMLADSKLRAGDDIRDALRRLCDDARVHDLRAEQLVIAIKRGWSSLHQERPRPRIAGPDELLNSVITLCIDEYYRDARAADDDSPADHVR